MRIAYVSLTGRYRETATAVMGTEYAVTTDRFQEAKFNWPLIGNESWKATVASVPLPDQVLIGMVERPSDYASSCARRLV